MIAALGRRAAGSEHRVAVEARGRLRGDAGVERARLATASQRPAWSVALPSAPVWQVWQFWNVSCAERWRHGVGRAAGEIGLGRVGHQRVVADVAVLGAWPRRCWRGRAPSVQVVPGLLWQSEQSICAAPFTEAAVDGHRGREQRVVIHRRPGPTRPSRRCRMGRICAWQSLQLGGRLRQADDRAAVGVAA